MCWLYLSTVARLVLLWTHRTWELTIHCEILCFFLFFLKIHYWFLACIFHSMVRTLLPKCTDCSKVKLKKKTNKNAFLPPILKLEKKLEIISSVQHCIYFKEIQEVWARAPANGFFFLNNQSQKKKKKKKRNTFQNILLLVMKTWETHAPRND